MVEIVHHPKIVMNLRQKSPSLKIWVEMNLDPYPRDWLNFFIRTPKPHKGLAQRAPRVDSNRELGHTRAVRRNPLKYGWDTQVILSTMGPRKLAVTGIQNARMRSACRPRALRPIAAKRALQLSRRHHACPRAPGIQSRTAFVPFTGATFLLCVRDWGRGHRARAREGAGAMQAMDFVGTLVRKCRISFTWNR